VDAGPNVVMIESGPAGLSCAAELIARSVPTTVLERGDGFGAAWSSRYDALRFNTCRLHSALPGAPFPRTFGQFPTRDQYVSYLRDYAQRRGVRVEHGVEVTGLDPAADGGWQVRTARGARHADHVVVATGVFNRPKPAYRPGRDDCRGRDLRPHQDGDTLEQPEGVLGPNALPDHPLRQALPRVPAGRHAPDPRRRGHSGG
jgi:cation diffusion facilitator CzcD-associated flavoprotein CzcO